MFLARLTVRQIVSVIDYKGAVEQFRMAVALLMADRGRQRFNALAKVDRREKSHYELKPILI